MSEQRDGGETDLEYCVRREKEERAAAIAAPDLTSRDHHFMAAERFADRAWSLREQGDEIYVPSGLWP